MFDDDDNDDSGWYGEQERQAEAQYQAEAAQRAAEEQQRQVDQARRDEISKLMHNGADYDYNLPFASNVVLDDPDVARQEWQDQLYQRSEQLARERQIREDARNAEFRDRFSY